MNRKSSTAACRSPEQTRPRLLTEYRALAATACSHAEAGSTHHARPRSDPEPPPPGGPRFGQPGRPTREWSGRSAQTRGQDRQDYGQHGPGRPSVGEIPANMVGVFLASAAPLTKASGCPPNRVNPNPLQEKQAQAADHGRTRLQPCIEPLPGARRARHRPPQVFPHVIRKIPLSQTRLRRQVRHHRRRPQHRRRLLSRVSDRQSSLALLRPTFATGLMWPQVRRFFWKKYPGCLLPLPRCWPKETASLHLI